MKDSNTPLAAMRKDIKATLKTVLLVNRSLQSFKQDTLLRFENIEKRLDGFETRFAELKELILRG